MAESHRYLSLLGGDYSESSSDDLRWKNWIDRHSNTNSTNMDDDQVATQGDNAITVVLLSLVILLLITGSIMCFNLEKIRQRPRGPIHAASDGKTVASVEDDMVDLEEGEGKSDAKPDVIKVRIVFIENGEEENSS